MVKNNRDSDNNQSKMDSHQNPKQNKQTMNKNMQRLGGRGLSLHAFANAKTFNKDYNPSVIKKKKEFYRNAKFVKKYQKTVKQQEEQPDLVGTSMNQHEKQNNHSMDEGDKGTSVNHHEKQNARSMDVRDKGTSVNHPEKQNNRSMSVRDKEDGNDAVKENTFSKKRRGREKSKNAFSLTEVYKKKREEEEKARLEREALFQARKEEKQKAETRRKDLREKMFKKTRKGQPVMKYRIEHLLETIQASN